MWAGLVANIPRLRVGIVRYKTEHLISQLIGLLMGVGNKMKSINKTGGEKMQLTLEQKIKCRKHNPIMGMQIVRKSLS